MSTPNFLRTVPPEENWPCHVGSGECHRPGVRVCDDGSGGEFFVCDEHTAWAESVMQSLIAMSPDELAALEKEMYKRE